MRGAELVLFSVKTVDTEAAAKSIAPHLSPGAIILSLQNGVDNVARIAAAARAFRAGLGGLRRRLAARAGPRAACWPRRSRHRRCACRAGCGHSRHLRARGRALPPERQPRRRTLAKTRPELRRQCSHARLRKSGYGAAVRNPFVRDVMADGPGRSAGCRACRRCAASRRRAAKFPPARCTCSRTTAPLRLRPRRILRTAAAPRSIRSTATWRGAAPSSASQRQ